MEFGYMFGIMIFDLKYHCFYDSWLGNKILLEITFIRKTSWVPHNDVCVGIMQRLAIFSFSITMLPTFGARSSLEHITIFLDDKKPQPSFIIRIGISSPYILGHNCVILSSTLLLGIYGWKTIIVFLTKHQYGSMYNFYIILHVYNFVFLHVYNFVLDFNFKF